MKEKDKFLRKGCISVMLSHGLVEQDPHVHEKSRVMMNFSADERGLRRNIKVYIYSVLTFILVFR